MTEVWKRIYKENVVKCLEALASRNYQETVWLNASNAKNPIGCFDEAVCMLFDDCMIGDYLKDGEIILDKNVTRALWDLSAAIKSVDGSRTPLEIIHDPLTEVVRQKSERALFFINISTGEGSTVDVAAAGQSAPNK